MAGGELIDSRLRSRSHHEVSAELREIGGRSLLDADDLVIARTGADHVCNWFFGVKAGVITSLERDDFERYDDVFILNPRDGTPDFTVLQDRSAKSERNRYEIMLRNVAVPEAAEPVFVGEHLELYRLELPPESWIFDEDGRWLGHHQVPPVSRNATPDRVPAP